MKHRNSSRLWVTFLLLLSCMGAFYFASFVFQSKDSSPLTSDILASSETTQMVPGSNTALPAEAGTPTADNLSQFEDAAILRLMPNQEAMSQLIKYGNFRPQSGNSFLPNADVSLIEFLSYSMNWLKSRNNGSLPLQTAQATVVYTGLTATGEAVTVEMLQTLGFEDKTTTILEAAGYEIPLFSKEASAYQQPVQRGQAALILSKLAKNALSEELPTAVDNENYLENAFALRLDPYSAEIGHAFALGLFSVKEFPFFTSELPISRSQTASILMRLFEKEKRENNPVRPRETLNNNASDYHSKAIYLFNNSSKSTVFSYNEEQRLSPASLTKIMTVYLAIERISDLETKVAVSPTFRKKMLRSGASIAGFYANERVTYEDLLYATLLSSGAEAAGTLAIQLAGSETAFIALMNQKAKELGMKNTHFLTVEGLDTAGQYTTAKDIAILMESALKNPTFYKVASTAVYHTSKTRLHPRGLKLQSTVLRNVSASEQSGFQILGGKSGTTAGAGLCWATFAEKNGTSYILVTMGAPLDNIYKPTMYQKADALKIYQGIRGSHEKNEISLNEKTSTK